MAYYGITESQIPRHYPLRPAIFESEAILRKRCRMTSNVLEHYKVKGTPIYGLLIALIPSYQNLLLCDKPILVYVCRAYEIEIRATVRLSVIRPYHRLSRKLLREFLSNSRCGLYWGIHPFFPCSRFITISFGFPNMGVWE